MVQTSVNQLLLQRQISLKQHESKHTILLKMSQERGITQPETVEKSLTSSLMLIEKQTPVIPLNLA